MSRLSALRIPAVVLAGSLAFTACGSDSKATTDTTTGDGATTTVKSADVSIPKTTGTLNGQGATFPKAFYEDAIDEFKTASGGTINYQGTGSGAGRKALADQTADFAASDGLVKDEDKATFKGGEFLYFPTVAAPITVSYNLSGTKDLKLDADTLGKIFSRQIKTWDDAAIKALNPSATLPAGKAITVEVRAESSGTSENFTKYLSAAAPASFTIKAGSQPEWPADVVKSQGNGGVAKSIKDTDGAIGYVDLADATSAGLSTASLKNKSGEFIAPSIEGAAAAVEGTTLKDDLTYNPLDAAGAKAYPITSPTWILAYSKQTDATKAATLKAFLLFLETDGQDLAKDAGFAKLPASFTAKAIAQVDKITGP